MSENVAILGASDRPERYSYKAMKMLQEKGHTVYLVSPRHSEIEGQSVYSALSDITDKIDTVTMYVSEQISKNMLTEFLKLNPKRVIFNPGSENPSLENALNQNKIETTQGCTLVMLSVGNF